MQNRRRVKRCPTEKHRKFRTAKCRTVRKRKNINRLANNKKGMKRKRAIVRHRKRPRMHLQLLTFDPYHPYVRPGAYNADRDYGLEVNLRGLRLAKPTRCAGKMPYQCNSNPNCQWNDYRNHCEARPEVFAGKRFEGPLNKI